MRCEKAKNRTASLFSLKKKKTGKNIDRSLFRIRIALPALVASPGLYEMVDY
jgi:hypothetical protein